MKKAMLKITSLLLLLFVIVTSLAFILYPNYSDIQMFRKQLNSQQIAGNATLNIFSKISHPAISGVTDTQGNQETLEYISKDILKEHRTKYGFIKLEEEDTNLIIDSVEILGKIVDGDDANAMDRGFWHYPLSSAPGFRGNTIIIGHRFLNIPPRTDTLFNLDKVRIGDQIVIEQEFNSYSYTVINTFVVDKNDVSVLENTNDYRVTIITCTPLWSSDQRLIVVGKMDRVYGNI
jgi:sortase A